MKIGCWNLKRKVKEKKNGKLFVTYSVILRSVLITCMSDISLFSHCAWFLGFCFNSRQIYPISSLVLSQYQARSEIIRMVCRHPSWCGKFEPENRTRSLTRLDTYSCRGGSTSRCQPLPPPERALADSLTTLYKGHVRYRNFQPVPPSDIVLFTA